jgi:penicillin-binding protein 1A
VNLDRAVARRNVVLGTMLENGTIDRATYDRARQAPVHLENGLQRDESFGQYFKEQVRRELVERFGWGRVASSGLRVYTTIDPGMQQAAERALEAGLRAIEQRSRYKHQTREAFLAEVGGVVRDGVRPPYLQGGLVAIDPRTGYVRVMVGGRQFTESRFNRAVQARRQPGSAFKPFVYAAALEAGMTPASLITGLDEPVDTPQGGWMPEDEHLESSAMTVRTALRTSSNRAAVRAFQTVGLDREMEAIDRLQFGEIPRVPSIALGAGEVTLQQLTAAYAPFANGGSLPRPLLIRRVEDRDGEVLYESEPLLTPAFTPTTAFLMANMLTDVVNAGTGYKARADGFRLPAAGKTGTTNDYVDAWFVGFTPSLVAGVWVGFDQPRTIVAGGYGGDLAVPVWADFMKAATKDDKPVWLKPPADVVSVQICRMSGRRPASNCGDVEVISRDGETKVRSMIMYEHFVKGTEPYDECPLHQGEGLLTRLGGLFGGRSSPAPVPEAASPLPERSIEPPAVTDTAAPARVEARREEEPKKKRGFWSRLFGSRKERPAADRDSEREPDQDRDRDPDR